MKIAMLSPVAPAHGIGGVQDLVWSLARGLAAGGHQVTLITTGRPHGPAHEHVAGVEIRYLRGVPPMRATGRWRDLSERTVAALQAHRPLDVIHSQSFCGLHLAGRLPGVPVVATLHGTHVDELRTLAGLMRENLRLLPRPSALLGGARAALLWAMMERRYRAEAPGLSRCEAVIATSREQRAVLERHYRVPADRLHEVWNGIDAAMFAPRPADSARRAELGVPPGEPLVLAVARLYQDKGIQHLLRAWPQVRARVPAAHLAVVGDGAYRSTLEQLTDRLGLGESVRFVGAVEPDALPALYAAADVFVNPTVRIDGYDLTILQAMACARPVVVSNIGSVPTAVTDGVDGELVPPGDSAALAAAIAGVLRRPDHARALAEAGRRTVAERFSLEAMVRGTLEVYRVARVRAGGQEQRA